MIHVPFLCRRTLHFTLCFRTIKKSKRGGELTAAAAASSVKILLGAVAATFNMLSIKFNFTIEEISHYQLSSTFIKDLA
jgi:hypothetical protein